MSIYSSELSVARRARKCTHLSNVGDATAEHGKPLESNSKTSVWHGAIAPQIQVPPVHIAVEFELVYALFEFIQPLFAL